MELFGELAHEMRDFLEARPGVLPAEVLQVSPKISKGENYRGLPYVVLDYPRYFSREQVLAVRTFFWWGNFISVTLHLKGAPLERYRGALLARAGELADAGFYICIAPEEWRHDFEADNYIPVGQCSRSSLDDLLMNKPFCKLAVRISLQQWNDYRMQLPVFYRHIFSLLGC